MGCIPPIILSNMVCQMSLPGSLRTSWGYAGPIKICSVVTRRISHGGEGWSDSGVFLLCSISELLRFGQSRSRHLLGSVVERQPRTNRITLQPEEKDTGNSPWKLGSRSLLGWAPTPLQRWEHSVYLQWVEYQRPFTNQQQQSTPASLYRQ